MNKPRVCHTYEYLSYKLEVFTKFGFKLTHESLCKKLNYSAQTHTIEDSEEMFRDYVDNLVI